MNADDAPRKNLAELTRLLPTPAERELPAGRQHALKEHLMSELRLAGRPPARGPATRRRMKPAITIAIAAAATAAATVPTLLPGSTPGAPPAAVRLLSKIAAVAAAQPSPHVRDSQFSYIRGRVTFPDCRSGWGRDCRLIKQAYEDQTWQSVSNLCVTGLDLLDGQKVVPVRTPGIWSVTTPHPHGCPDRGDVHDPTYRFLQSLPTDPHALLGLIEREMQGLLPRPEEAFITIGQLLGAANPPPPVSAALYRAAALIPGVTVVADATDAIGRHGVAVALTNQGTRAEWIFSRQTLLYLGARVINVANGATSWMTAVLQRAFVDRVGQLPG